LLYSKYPFVGDLRRLSKIVLHEELDALELLELIPEGIEKAKDFIERAAGKRKRPYSCDELCTVLGYKLAVLIAAALNDKWIQNKLAAVISEESYEKFKNDDIGTVVNIVRKLGYDVETLNKPLSVPVKVYKGSELSEIYPIRLHLNSYVQLASRFLSDPHWKVVNKALLGGFVYLKPEEFIRLAQEAVYKKVIEDIKDIGRIEVEDLPEKLKEIINSVTSEVRKSIAKRKKIEVSVKGLKPEALPPCISAIYKRALEGANLSHQERFTLATFLLNVGMDVDEVLDVFSRAPDYNERIARYQIEHLAGLRGSRKKYSPPSCKTLVSWNLCPGRDECKANHPLSEYKRRLWKLRKTSRERSNGKNEDERSQGNGSGAEGLQRVDGKLGGR